MSNEQNKENITEGTSNPISTIAEILKFAGEIILSSEEKKRFRGFFYKNKNSMPPGL
ncbi:MAG: hypothetical protein IK012_01275 [Fibrobacter sp.]|uniref:hypothetical protein n=1 Tax=Fibrobacter sp. TaxID=35828 RepID=UPI0025BE98E5|nr:hypothetical protein [Fibrobacter sp.]MBR4783872.1 hypothetical protein [Fibrobacter sp.]